MWESGLLCLVSGTSSVFRALNSRGQQERGERFSSLAISLPLVTISDSFFTAGASLRLRLNSIFALNFSISSLRLKSAKLNRLAVWDMLLAEVSSLVDGDWWCIRLLSSADAYPCIA